MTPLPASSPSPPSPPRPNTAFRRLRGQLSPSEFAAAVRRAAREIGEQVSCDPRYIGRVESGAIRCPNYAYERVFLHMFPGRTLTDLGFSPREAVRGHRARPPSGPGPVPDPTAGSVPGPRPAPGSGPGAGVGAEPGPGPGLADSGDPLRRAFLFQEPVGAPGGRVGEPEAAAVEEAVRRIRLLDDRHGADSIYPHTAQPLNAAYALLDAGARRRSIADRLYAGAGELAISVGWLAHDSGRLADARAHYAEALATARVTGDPALEAHAFCNAAFLARDTGRPREAVRAAQAAQRAAGRLASPRLLSLIALREAGGWAWLTDRAGCERALLRAQALFSRGPSDSDPEWMTFYGEAELEGLEAQCWSALGDWGRAVEHARRAVALQNPHFTRNIALFTTELASDLLADGAPDAAAVAAARALELMDQVKSSRIRRMLDETARVLRPHGRNTVVSDFLARYEPKGRDPVERESARRPRGTSGRDCDRYAATAAWLTVDRG
ncbi:tetratricopeptide repeat protein [Streptomyces sp. ME19-01-6]|uniref:tetratricopeptide repeat protein n=1 Tax=Streptomyces sp. ME19-01-6 TaxID=3028686 RepID=UPI0029B8EC26|nr:tetratricopeptide repeat protein [Streptomyces sp. ME19-01-6]MDX3229799.1 tetratricopeptide repeat protein [Streptomyces sp. ME19-01-6]